jgi:uncharacterized protein
MATRGAPVRIIQADDLDDVAIGAAVLGTGGGGDPYIGMLMAKQAIAKHGPVRLIDVDELADDALVVPAAMMGAPTVLVEKIPAGGELTDAFTKLEAYLGRRIDAVLCGEAGGMNSTTPFVVAAETGLPWSTAMVWGAPSRSCRWSASPARRARHADGDGRRQGELGGAQHHRQPLDRAPGARGHHRDGRLRADRLLRHGWRHRQARGAARHREPGAGDRPRAARGQRGASATACRPWSTTSAPSGSSPGRSSTSSAAPSAASRAARPCSRASTATAVERCRVAFQNEFLVARTEDRVLASTPDLITILDADDGSPITTESLRYGFRVQVLGIPCDPQWRTPEGLELVGPAYFGYDIPFVPVEDRAQRPAART